LVGNGDYAGACLKLLDRPGFANSIRTNAARMVRETRSWPTIGKRYEAFFEAATH
jgi:glycosyltransferase involved in cell wall biosynthesis